MSDKSELITFPTSLDERLSRALSKQLNITEPTLIQSKVIQLALEGKDIVAKARTGSGKTLAYCLPICQKLLNKSRATPATSNVPCTRAVILVPTRDLAEQVTGTIRQLVYYCAKEITFANIAGDCSMQSLKIALSESPDIVIAIPSRLLNCLESNHVLLRDSLSCVVIDEADLVLSFGYEDDIRAIMTHLPKIYQSFLMSATLTDDVEMLKKMLLHSPVIIKLEEGKDEENRLTHYTVKCQESDKFLLLFFIIKLRLINGKCIIFVNDVERGYRLKLFLEQFSIRSCLLNSELPYSSRYHIVQEFNRGIYPYLIATDEMDLKSGAGADGDEEEISKQQPTQKAAKKPVNRKDKEYGVSRGIDFKDVDAVINFDFPASSRSYTHRAGRTARANKSGMAFSFVTDKDKRTLTKVEHKYQSKHQITIQPYEFDMTQAEGFRYRCDDALRAVTRNAIREARLKEIKMEVLNSEKLKTHFSLNPKDLEALRHDKPLHNRRVQSHLKHIPDYLVPTSSGVKRLNTAASGGEDVSFHKKKRRTQQPRPSRKQQSSKGRGNPLKSLIFAKPK